MLVNLASKVIAKIKEELRPEDNINQKSAGLILKLIKNSKVDHRRVLGVGLGVDDSARTDTLQEYPSYESIVRAAQEDKIKVFCIDGPPALYFLYKLNLEQDYRQTAPLYTGQFHRAVPKGRKDLLTVVEKGFAKISRRERDQIEKRWLGAPIFLPHYLPYVFYLIGAFAILGVILMLWNHTLRRKVTQKTALLRETIDALRKSGEEQRRDREDAERSAEEMAVIAEIGRVIGSSLEIDDVYERFAAEARKLIPFDRIAVNLHSLHEENVRMAYTFGEDVPGRRPGDLFPLKNSVSEVLAKTRAGLLRHLNNIEEMQQQFPDRHLRRHSGDHEFLVKRVLS